MPYWFIKLVFSILKIFHLDKRFDTLFWKLKGFRPSSRWHRQALEKAFDYAMRLGVANRGDYYEFGIYKGYCLWYAGTIARKHGLRMRFFGFDSFAGIPKPTGIDANGDFYEGQFACSLSSVRHNLVSHGADMSSITLVKGYFNHSLVRAAYTKYKLKKIAIALIDCDLYSSTNSVLEFVKPLLQKHTILLFDDWNSFDADENRGQRRSLREFLERNPTIKLEKGYTFGWHGLAMRVIAL